jgi:predicted DCC family thiol-disulfide oxidoreductase YuxK
MVYIEGGRALTRSSAALAIARRLDGALPLLAFFRVVPVFLRDAVYRFVARNRYRWFGRLDACRIPDASQRERFLA